MSKPTKINPAKFYTLSEMADQGLFPWCDNIATYRKWVLADRKGRNVLKATITGTGRAARYYVKGENIIKFIAHVENGSHRG